MSIFLRSKTFCFKLPDFGSSKSAHSCRMTQLSFSYPMRVTLSLFLVTALTMAVAAGHADMKPQDNELDGSAIFNDLSKEDASKKAREMAESDFARNVYRIFVVGKRPAKSAYDDYLKEHYGVLAIPIAGCIVSDGIIGAQEGYNSTMKPLLNRKFGHDIFKEAEEEGRR